MPAIQYGRQAIDDYWTSNRELIKDFSDRFIKHHAEKMMEEVTKVATSPDPRMANKKLASLIIEFAQFQVLVIDPPPADDPTGLRGQPGITGELKAHLFDLAQKDERLREYMHAFDTPKDWGDVWDPVLVRYQVVAAWTQVFNRLRFAFNDFNPTESKDWFKPCVAAICASKEHQYRDCLGMPPSLDDSGMGAGLRALMMCGFLDCVLEGARFPDLEWRERVQKIERDEEVMVAAADLMAAFPRIF